MKKSFLLLFLISAAFSLSAQGIEFFQGTWAEALEEARRQDKILFVDAYAVWCGPCKRMSKNVFPNDKVGAFYNKNFVNLKIDMEHGDMDFRRKYPVSAYPTMYYIDYDGEVVHKVASAMDVEAFIKLGETALSKIDRSKDFVVAYEDGNRDPELVYDYVKALNKVGKPSLAISNEYLRGQSDLSTPENLRFILEAAIESDSRIFDLLIDNRRAIEQLEGETAVFDRIELACNNTLGKAIEYQSVELLEEAKGKMKIHHRREQAEMFALKADRDYARSAGEVDAYIKACSAFVKKVGKNNSKELFSLAREAEAVFPDSGDAIRSAEKWAGMAAKNSEDYTVHYTYARLLLRNGKHKEALKAANQAKDYAENGPRGAADMVEELIRKISG